MLFQGVYVTYVYEGGPAHQSGLQVHDKLLQVTSAHLHSPLPILSMSGVDRHDCLSPGFSILFCASFGSILRSFRSHRNLSFLSMFMLVFLCFTS